MEDMLTNLSTYGYIVLFLYSFGGGFVALVAGGVLSFMGEMNLFLVLIIAGVANFLGDSMLFYMGRYHKSEMMGYLHKHKRKLALSHLLMKRRGSLIVLLQKFVYGIKTLVPIAIGLTKYNFFKFSILNAIGAFIWAIVFGVGSYLSGDIIIEIFNTILDKPYIAPIMLVIFGGAMWLYMEKVTKKVKK
ncbi:MAG: DedA family protein [Helicobacteraceae bacterium]|nr:DedA family protein [Helicobacteraceae bacterium]